MLLFIVAAIYVNIYYAAKEFAKEEMKSDEVVEVYHKKKYYVFEPKEYSIGIIFHPGGKVEATAYAPYIIRISKTKNLSNLPSFYKEYVISDGCHAYFGSYGKQDGDGIPTISYTNQIQEIVSFIVDNLC